MDPKISDPNTMNPTIAAAIIGAVVAILVIVIRDVVIATLIKRREEHEKLLSEQLSHVYSPLMYYMGGVNYIGLAVVEYDQELHKLVKTNLHLLSPSLRNMITEATTMGKNTNGGRAYTISELPRMNELNKKFRERLVREYEDLLNKYNKIK